MSDDTRIINIIAEHEPDEYGYRCTGCMWKPRNSSVTDYREFAEHLLAALREEGYQLIKEGWLNQHG